MQARWLKRLKGHLPAGEACGLWDLHVQLAIRFNWTPQQVNEMDPWFVQELTQFIVAEQKHQEWERKQTEAKTKANKNT